MDKMAGKKRIRDLEWLLLSDNVSVLATPLFWFGDRSNCFGVSDFFF